MLHTTLPKAANCHCPKTCKAGMLGTVPTWTSQANSIEQERSLKEGKKHHTFLEAEFQLCHF